MYSPHISYKMLTTTNLSSIYYAVFCIVVRNTADSEYHMTVIAFSAHWW